MKPIYFKIPKTGNQSIRIQVDKGVHFYDKLHYHPEFQITLIEKGDGLFFGGTETTKFKPGDIFLIGNNIPHLLKSAKNYYEMDSPGVLSTSLFFSDNSLGSAFFELPEMHLVANLLKSAGRVIKLDRVEEEHLAELILGIKNASAEGVIIMLLQILQEFNRAGKDFLNSEVVEYELKEAGFARMDKVLNFTFSNFSENISIEMVAEQANLSRSQFSRYFKERTGKSYINFLNEVRIENACSQLMTEESTIEKVGYDVGFQNISNFNRQFKKVKHITPSAYRTKFLKH